MSWIPTEKEIVAVLQLDDQKRYDYWLRKVAELRVVWSVAQKGSWALTADGRGGELVPVWPHEEFAAECAKEAWPRHSPKPIQLNTWFERWVPGMERDGRLVAVFPTPGSRGLAVEPARLETDLRRELANYE